jgi:hypothetical protein
VILTIGLGVGASAASFDRARIATVLRPLPFKDSDRLAQSRCATGATAFQRLHAAGRRRVAAERNAQQRLRRRTRF